MQAVIMAGGKGTRLAELTRDEIPKPMVELAGKPLLLWQIERLKENGIQDILLVIGHLGSVIRIRSFHLKLERKAFNLPEARPYKNMITAAPIASAQ